MTHSRLLSPGLHLVFIAALFFAFPATAQPRITDSTPSNPGVVGAISADADAQRARTSATAGVAIPGAETPRIALQNPNALQDRPSLQLSSKSAALSQAHGAKQESEPKAPVSPKQRNSLAAAPKSTAPKSPTPQPPTSAAKQAGGSGQCIFPEVEGGARFGAGETLNFDVDSIGAKFGSFSTHIVPGQAPASWVLSAKTETGSFASNFLAASGKAKSQLNTELESLSYEEDSIVQGNHRSVDLSLPVPASGELLVRSSINGKPREQVIRAPQGARDLLSALHVARGLPLADGDEICLSIVTGHLLWRLDFKVLGREELSTPVGQFNSIHLEGKATLSSMPSIVREVHLWYSDDEHRLPLAAFGLVKGKPVRAQLVAWQPGKKSGASMGQRQGKDR